MTSAWVLNLDADLELSKPVGPYTPPASIQARTRDLALRIDGLLQPGDVRVDLDEAPPAGAVGRAWCPTPRALELLAAAGVALPPAPPVELLRRVNHRGFSADLGQTLDGARFVTELSVLERLLAQPTASGYWLMKRPHGFSGLGHRRAPVGSLDHKARVWVDASLRVDGLQLEPWVERQQDFAIHGHIAPDGSTIVGAPCIQRCTPQGAWLHTARAEADELSDDERDALNEEARRGADALAAAGYFGPFGVDAFRYVAGGGERFNPRCELNARYTMGWAIGLPSRPDLA